MPQLGRAYRPEGFQHHHHLAPLAVIRALRRGFLFSPPPELEGPGRTGAFSAGALAFSASGGEADIHDCVVPITTKPPVYSITRRRALSRGWRGRAAPH